MTLLEGPAVAVGAITAEVHRAPRSPPGCRSPGRPPGESQLQVFPNGPLAPTPPSPWPWQAAAPSGSGSSTTWPARASGAASRATSARCAHGEVTTGSVKLAGLAATGLAGGLLLGGRRSDVLINAGLIAGGANLLNLFDLRPGRAVKVAALSAGLIAAGGAGGPDRSAGLAAVAAPLGAGLALLPEDLAERAMLGDAGANALGAMLGAAAAGSLPRSARAGLLAGIVALTVASEKVSFTKVIERHPGAAQARHARPPARRR